MEFGGTQNGAIVFGPCYALKGPVHLTEADTSQVVCLRRRQRSMLVSGKIVPGDNQIFVQQSGAGAEVQLCWCRSSYYYCPPKPPPVMHATAAMSAVQFIHKYIDFVVRTHEYVTTIRSLFWAILVGNQVYLTFRIASFHVKPSISC